MKYINKSRIIVLIVLALLFVFGVQKRNALKLHRYEEQSTRLGTLVQLVVVIPKDIIRAEKLFQIAYDEMARLDKIFSRYRTDSELSLLNQNSGKAHLLSEDFSYVLSAALQIGVQTEGAFDCTILPLLKRWRQAGQENRLPTLEEVFELQRNIGFQKIQFDEDKRILQFPVGVSLDLGGIAKGYVIERIRDLWKEAGVANALINIGGDLWAMGHNDHKVSWRLAIQDPQDPTKALKLIEISNQGMVTSGDYQRNVTIEGQNYSHIINPRTGWPVVGARSLTLVGDRMMEIDAWATALSVMGKKHAEAIVAARPEWQMYALFDE